MSAISKNLLIFDAANPDTSDNVGAYLRSADGTLLTHTTNGAKEALDVNMVNEIEVNLSASGGDNVAISDGVDTLAINADGSLNAIVTATDLDIRDLDSAQDSVEVLQATHDNLNANANLQVGDADVANGNPVPVSDAGGSLTVDAIDLDIRDLVFATDKVDVSGSAVTVSATDLDIRDLSSATDSVTAVGNVADDAADAGNPIKVGSRALSGALAPVSANNDRADLISDLYRRIWINSSANISSLASQVNVTNVATALPATPLAGRRKVLIQNSSSAQVFIGHSGVTTGTGVMLSPGSNVEMEVGDDVQLYGISSTVSNKDVRVLEIA